MRVGVSSPCASFLLRVEKKLPVSDGSGSGEQHRIFRFSLFFSLFFFLPWLILPKINRYHPKSAGKGENSPNRRYYHIVRGPRTDQHADWYIPLGMGGTHWYCRTWYIE
ncbi:hypothetical protein BHM03_00059801 [Ensete ventricosum]|nr:hypothetical protein BHM03_00059801 [Ensete ventricosum]